MTKNKLAVALATVVAATSTLTFVGPAEAHTTGIHDNCTNLNKKWPHGVGLRTARDHTTGTPVRNFKNNRAYWAAERHNGTLDRDNDRIACEKR